MRKIDIVVVLGSCKLCRIAKALYEILEHKDILSTRIYIYMLYICYIVIYLSLKMVDILKTPAIGKTLYSKKKTTKTICRWCKQGIFRGLSLSRFEPLLSGDVWV